MSRSELQVQGHKRRTDCAIHHACAQLKNHPLALETFHELLHCARQRAPHLFHAPVINGHHSSVNALVNLSRFQTSHLRRVTSWSGSHSSWRPAIASLAHHLIGKYKVPAFLSAAWYDIGADAESHRHWFIMHSSGASFRSLQLPISMTRRMERIFLASPDHQSIDSALRRAELVALGASTKMVEAILSTRAATDLQHGDFWPTVWHFLIANAAQVEPVQVGPLIDYIHAVRHQRVRVETPDGFRYLEPPVPNFSMRGRTLQSLTRLMSDWHRSLANSDNSLALTWSPSQLQPMVVDEPGIDNSSPPKRWQMLELTSSAQLRSEGAALHHCVGSYASLCYRGHSHIFSLRCWRGEKLHHVLTVEVDPTRRIILQARGMANRAPSGKPLQLLRDWAERERLVTM